jgi:hypothetical protein
MGLWLGSGQVNQKILTIEMMTKIKSLFFNGLNFVSVFFFFWVFATEFKPLDCNNGFDMLTKKS